MHHRWLLLLLLAAATAGCEPTEVEPTNVADSQNTPNIDEQPRVDIESNDRFEVASQLDGNGWGELSANDLDYYRTDGLPGLFRVDVTADSSEFSVAVVSSDVVQPSLTPRHIIQAVRADPDLALLITPTSSEQVRYSIVVTPLELADSGPILTEPNTFDQPHQVAQFPARIVGFYDGAGDRDAIELATELFEGRRAVLIEISPIPNARPVLNVLTVEGDRLTSLSAQRPGDPVGIPNFGPIPGQDPILIEITDANESNLNDPYTISIHDPPLTAEAIEVEPNDTLALARRITSGETVTGMFHSDSDVDVYLVRPGGVGATSIFVTPDSFSDVQISWVDSDALRTSSDVNGIGGVEGFCSQPTIQGDYFLEIASMSRDETAGLSTYSVTVNIESGNIEREPNGLSDTGPRQALDGELQGYIQAPGDVDVFSWTLITAVGSRPSYTVTVDPPDEVDVALEVLDSDMTRLASTDRRGQGGQEQAELDQVPMGTYFVVVRGEDGSACEPYTLAVE